MNESVNKTYQRIIILGAAGAGKTTLAKRIAKRTGLPMYNLDKEYWLPNWERPNEEDWENKVKELVKQDSWIMDGNYLPTLDIRLNRADLVIVLDINLTYCLRGIFFRTLTGHFYRRKDLSDGCYDRFDETYNRLVVWVKKFPKDQFPQIIDLCIRHKDVDLELFTTRQQARKYIINKFGKKNEKII